MSDSPLDAFQLLLISNIISLIQNCTNVEARKAFRNEDWSMSRFELLAFRALIYVRRSYGGKNIPLDSF